MPDDARLPHEILLAIARGEAIDGHIPTLAERMTAAKIAAPFYAPRLASVAHEVTSGGQVIDRVEVVIVNPEDPSGAVGRRPTPDMVQPSSHPNPLKSP